MLKLILITALLWYCTIYSKKINFKTLFHILIVEDSRWKLSNYINFFYAAEPMNRNLVGLHIISFKQFSLLR